LRVREAPCLREWRLPIFRSELCLRIARPYICSSRTGKFERNPYSKWGCDCGGWREVRRRMGQRAVTQFAAAAGWNVRVFAKHDAQYIYFDFEGVTHPGVRLFPEILVDPRNTKSVAWQEGQWWLHVSNNLCEGNGAPNVHERKGKSLCTHSKPGWDANNPPEAGTESIEVKISFAKLGAAYSPEMKIGLAFDMTDATGKAEQKTYYGPASAKIDSPKTWGVAVLE